MQQIAVAQVMTVGEERVVEHRHAWRGHEYSLIRLLVVIAVIGILGSIAVLPERSGGARDPLIALLVVIEVVGILMAIAAARFRA